MFWLVTAVIAFFTADGFLAHLEKHVKRHGLYVIIGRWLGARPRHGKAITNRGFARSGSGDAFTPTKHARWVWYLPAWQHIWRRATGSLAAVMLGAGLLFERERTETYLAVTATGVAAWSSLRAWYWAQSYTHRKNYLKPLHVRLAPLTGVPLTARPETWLEIPRDRTQVTVTMPRAMGMPTATERKAIEAAAAATVGMKNPRPKWQHSGPHMKLRLTSPYAPPKWVYLDTIEWGGRKPPGVYDAMIRQAIKDADPDELVLGIGEDGKVVKISLRQDSPHMALSVDTGKGKSVLVRCIVPQVLLRGGIAAVLDNKLVSHPSLRGLPNVAYADEIELIHDFLERLDGELTKRAKFIRDHTDELGNLTGSPGPRLVVILEEQNLTMNRLQSYWSDQLAADRALPKEEREWLPAVSPAIRGFENASYVGRELGVHLVFISQRFTAQAAGGGSKGAAVRMNAGTRILAGYDDDTWKMLVGKQTPMPPPSKHAGRMQVYVKGGDLTETQIAFFTHQEARAMALTVKTPLPSWMRWESRIGSPAGRALPRGPSGPVVTVTPSAPVPPPVRGVTARQARESGWLPWDTDTGFRVALHRARKRGMKVPDPIGVKGAAKVYDAVELADFAELVKPESAKVGASA